MQSLSQFGRSFSKRAARMPNRVDKLKRKLSLQVDRGVVTGTPVDTGRARSNWVVTIGGPASGVREPFSPGMRLGIGESANARAAIAQAETVLARPLPVGAAIYLTNNTPYIGSLNRGSSRQAPKMFVETAVKVGIRSLDGFKIFV